MESILARALEYTLKYWLKSFTRDQFKLNGRTAQLSNLDINGDALHSSLGLPPALDVATAKIAKLEIKIPYVSNVQVEPIVVYIDRLDIILRENAGECMSRNVGSDQSTSSSGKGSSYGLADKIADGMTLEVATVNLMLETQGVRNHGSAAWASPLASFTMHNLVLCTTNEDWKVVNLKEARDFSNNRKSIYVFKKLEWEFLSVDLLPHPDMFNAASSTCSETKRDDDGAKRVFFGGERLLEGVSGEAYITIQRTKQGKPLGLEVQLHVSEAVCPSLSEPGLRALLRFMTGLCVCLNRGDVDPKAQQCSTQAAGRSLVSIMVDHVFLCIKDSEFQLDLLVQSLYFSRATVSDGEIAKTLTHVAIAGFFLRDTFSHPSFTLVQPLMQAKTASHLQVPDFSVNFCPSIYPLDNSLLKLSCEIPLVSLYIFQIKPSPLPPCLASQTVTHLQPLMINLQEEACLRIFSFLADGIVINPGSILPDLSISSVTFSIMEVDIMICLERVKNCVNIHDKHALIHQSPFKGATLQFQNLLIFQSPDTKFDLLDLNKDPACFCFWQGQPVDSSQKKWMIQFSQISLHLEKASSLVDVRRTNGLSGSWRCLEICDVHFEAAMATFDGSPLVDVPPQQGLVRVKVACDHYLLNTSIEQLFFVLDIYAYFGQISEQITAIRKSSKLKYTKQLENNLLQKMPGDTTASLAVHSIQLVFLESDSNIVEIPLVQFVGNEFSVEVSHKALGGAIAFSSSLHWQCVQVNCLHDMKWPIHNSSRICTESPKMRAMIWVDNSGKIPFLDVGTVHVMPYSAEDKECQSLSLSATVAGVRLGGGMSYTEAMLHRFGIFGPDGGPGHEFSKVVRRLSKSSLSKLLSSDVMATKHKESKNDEDGDTSGILDLRNANDVDICIEFKDWLFALEGADEEEGDRYLHISNGVDRERRSWHSTFQNLQVKTKSSPNLMCDHSQLQNISVAFVTVSVQGLQLFKPFVTEEILQNFSAEFVRKNRSSGGINVELQLLPPDNMETTSWNIENLKFSVKEPLEAVVTKVELEHLAFLCTTEADSFGRIAAGLLRIFKLDKSIGKASLNQLINLGSGSMGRILSPDKLSPRGSFSSIGCPSPLNGGGEITKQHWGDVMNMLEATVSDAEAYCSLLVTDLSSSEALGSLANMRELTHKFETMHLLLRKLQNQPD